MKIFHAFPQSLRKNAETVPEIRPRQLSSTSIPIHSSLIIISSEATQIHCDLLTVSLNKATTECHVKNDKLTRIARSNYARCKHELCDPCLSFKV
jgi:hypothetical protein